jgi:DUF1009 family protein
MRPERAARGEPAPQESIGLIAGNGQFPLLFARAARQQGVRVVAVAMQGETEPSIAQEVDTLTWVRVGQLGKMIRAFARAGVRRAAMAGGVRKTRLFGGARPDFLGLRVLARCVIRRDDGMLRAVAAEFERQGITIVDSTLFMPDALAPQGVLTAGQPSPREWQDLRYGFGVAQHIGQLDIGQTVVVKDGAVVALEAIEGTDACIRRAGELTHRRGAVMVKVAKPVQDMRFDVPAIGPATLDSCEAAGVRVVGIEAGRTLMIEPERLIAEANRRNLVLVGLDTSTSLEA